MKYALVFTVLFGAVTAAPLEYVSEKPGDVKVRSEVVPGADVASIEGKGKNVDGEAHPDSILAAYEWKEKKARSEVVPGDLDAEEGWKKNAGGEAQPDFYLEAHEWKEKKARSEVVPSDLDAEEGWKKNAGGEAHPDSLLVAHAWK
ncbi:uncharacterized protein RCO7_07889 [Rhynchosporium graminicola]|uniref:Mating factor alpha n=1 Tax=Rhynchosporium graminicola TaxID=2792576 RepID=A0A1E1KRI1_9HELO|nr:uncharacterized protein RCO7_07889 [Rhynchosporium commune]